MRVLIAAVTLAGCGSQSTDTSDGGAGTTGGSTSMVLTSPSFADGDALPDDLKCERDSGSGASPALAWTEPDEATAGFAITMHHFATGSDPDVDDPSSYWLLWNLEPDLRAIDEGNPLDLGNQGSDKDGVSTGYTAPCSPGGTGTHEYTLTLYAVSEQPASLGSADALAVDWAALTDAIASTTLGTATLTFVN